MSCWCADDNCLLKGKNSKNNIGEGRKKVGNSSDDFLILIIVVNRPYFLFKTYLTEKIMLRQPFCELIYGKDFSLLHNYLWQVVAKHF